MKRLLAAIPLLLFQLVSPGSTSGQISDSRTTPTPEDYALHCSACHTLGGEGVPDQVPSLHELAFVMAQPGGRDYVARVPGVAQAPLSDARLARLLNWILAEFSGIRATPPFNAVEVGAARRSPLRDPMAARKALFSSSPEHPDPEGR